MADPMRPEDVPPELVDHYRDLPARDVPREAVDQIIERFRATLTRQESTNG